LTKKSLRNVIGKILADTDFPTTVKFLDDMKNLGYMNAFKGGLSFSLVIS
jgi:DNA-directed RNA polymerase subunit beta'